MSAILGGGKDAARAGAAASEKQMKEQKRMIQRQESQLQSEQSELAKRTQATLRARQRGGQRMLMSDVEEESLLG